MLKLDTEDTHPIVEAAENTLNTIKAIGLGILIWLIGSAIIGSIAGDGGIIVFTILFAAVIVGRRFLGNISIINREKDNDPHDVNKKALAKRISDEFHGSPYFGDENGAIILDILKPAKSAFNNSKPKYGFITIDPYMMLTNAKDYDDVNKGTWNELSEDTYTSYINAEKTADYVVSELGNGNIVSTSGDDFCCFWPAIKYGSTFFDNIIICRKSLFDKVKHKLTSDYGKANKLYMEYVFYNKEANEAAQFKKNNS